MGSGKLLRFAIQKYGLENFTKEILFLFDSEIEMELKEKELVNDEFLRRSDVYNLCVGGQGGFSHINKNKELVTERNRKIISKRTFKESKNRDISKYDYKEITRKAVATKRERGTLIVPTTKGFIFSEESKKLMSEKASGPNSSQYGTMWITDGNINKKIKKDQVIPEGWNKGRKMPVGR